jgi:hypothetical protein
MKMTIYPTPEIWNAPINGVQVPVRVWIGETDSGIRVEAYVLSIVPLNPSDKLAVPDFMVKSRDMFSIAVDRYDGGPP